MGMRDDEQKIRGPKNGKELLPLANAASEVLSDDETFIR